MHEQRAAAAEARHLRAEYLVAVAKGMIDPVDLLEAARATSHRALRTIRLSQVFAARADDAPESTRNTKTPWPKLRRRLLAALDLAALPDTKMTVSWLLDPRAGGRRWLALHDALRSRDEAPWSGFPWEPPK